jgi:hypothetical protein
MPELPADYIPSILSDTNRRAARSLSDREPPIREVPEQQADCHAALVARLSDNPYGLAVRDTQLPVGKMLAPKFPGLGGVDLTIEREGSPQTLIELKLGTDTLWNCAWDLAKLALALRQGIAERAFMVGGAPVARWDRERQGPELFAPYRWPTEVFLARYRNCFRLWQPPQPKRLPSELRVEAIDRVEFESGGERWEMRVIEVVDDGVGWVEIGKDLVAHLVPTGDAPISLAPEESEEQPGDQNTLLRVEGGTIYLLNDADLLVNDAAARSMVPEEDFGDVELLRFDTAIDRENYVRDRGWLDMDFTRRGGPTRLYLNIEGQIRNVTVELNGHTVKLSRYGEIVASARPTEADWVRFFEEVEQLDPWSWGRQYSPVEFATDGEFWSVIIAHEGRLAHSHGYFVYPPDNGDDPSNLDALLATCLRLFGLDARTEPGALLG